MPRSNKRITVVAAILFNEEGQFLIARKKKGKSLAGFWEFPGGKVEENEIEEDALKREMVEEFSVEIEQLKLYHAYDFSYSETDYHFLFFTAIYRNDQNLIPVDHDLISWIDQQELKQYTFAPGDIPVVQFILENGFNDMK
ncbi:MAG: (deoxy)nucleoside triphosphate pyrophosphohydrolase [Bacteroidetes bacterium]|nr:(deoxy)nucleoside triphosphate pyrophosphohydrolase [Bacteroidota bacterium]